jgi:hypothetical protein
MPELLEQRIVIRLGGLECLLDRDTFGRRLVAGDIRRRRLAELLEQVGGELRGRVRR